MTDPDQAALWLAVVAVAVLVLCLGGTLLAAGLLRRPARQPAQSPRPATRQVSLG